MKDEDKSACELVENVKDDSLAPEATDPFDEEGFRRHSKSLVRKLDLTLMPMVCLGDFAMLSTPC